MSIEEYLKQFHFLEIEDRNEIQEILGHNIHMNTSVTRQINALLNVYKLQQAYASSTDQVTAWQTSVASHPKSGIFKLIAPGKAIDKNLVVFTVCGGREPVGQSMYDNKLFLSQKEALEWRVRTALYLCKIRHTGVNESLVDFTENDLIEFLKREKYKKDREKPAPPASVFGDVSADAIRYYGEGIRIMVEGERHLRPTPLTTTPWRSTNGTAVPTSYATYSFETTPNIVAFDAEPETEFDLEPGIDDD
jgi:hypothetical protein